MEKKLPWFVGGDLDGFLGLFIDNLLMLMVISVFCSTLCGMEGVFINSHIMTGAAVSLVVGNVFYAWQARKLALRTGNPNVTALPYGINTTTVVSFTFLVMLPVYLQTHDPVLAWKTGVFACLMSGVFETIGAFCCDWLRRNTPRAALLSCLAGVGITFIAMGFLFQIFANPVIAVAPAFLMIAAYGSNLRFPKRIPGGIVALLVGVIIAWGTKALGYDFFTPSTEVWKPAFYYPIPVVGDMFDFVINGGGWKFLSVIIPMALFSVIGSLENLESADAGGDHFETRSSLLVNGLGSIAAALFGSPFPTTIYIGHPGWKQMGARHGYSVLNAVMITVLILLGGMPLILKLIPIEVLLGILLWIGLIINAQAYQATPKRHAMAVTIGMIPCIASWALMLVKTTVSTCGASFPDIASRFGSDLYIFGLLALDQGFILTGIILSAVFAFCIDRLFLKAAAWLAVGAVLSFFGLIHAYQLTETGADPVYGWNVGPHFAIAYGLSALLLAALHFIYRMNPKADRA